MKRVFLLRHAKTQPDAPEGDHERQLTERGHADAALMARDIARRGYVPDLILSSTARRTLQTLEIILPAFKPTPQARLEPALYLASSTSILQRMSAVGRETGAVLFIGHNPGMEELALHLAGETDLGARVAEKFPTACFAAFESKSATWTEAARGVWQALAIVRPSDLRS